MNFRNIALVAALATVAGVNAQSFELRAGAGATLVGNTFVVAPTGNFSVEIWVNPGSAGLTGVTSVSLALAYDLTASTATSGLGPTGLQGKINASAANLATESFGLGALGSNVIRAGAAPGATANIQSGNNRALVVGRQFSAGTGSPINIAAPVKVATMTFSHNIANGDTFGDSANEVGLQMYFANAGGSSAGGTSAIGPAGSGRPGQVGSTKYAVQAVPEPGTMAALGLGLAAIARRRRNKK